MELSVKIRIGDREYPMTVKSEDEEKIRVAGKIINDRIKVYRNQFGIDDKQDLLAMVAFDCLVEKMRVEEHDSSDQSVLTKKISQLNQLITKSIQT